MKQTHGKANPKVVNKLAAMLTKYLSLARPISILTVLPLAMTLAASIGLSRGIFKARA